MTLIRRARCEERGDHSNSVVIPAKRCWRDHMEFLRADSRQRFGNAYSRAKRTGTAFLCRRHGTYTEDPTS